MNKHDSKTIAARLTLSDVAALQQLARKRSTQEGKIVRQSTLIREAITTYLNANNSR